MYTVLEGLRKTQEFADKLGSDILTIPIFLPLFEMEVLDFIGSRIAEAEKTQMITDDISGVIKPSNVNLIPDPSDSKYYLAIKPSDYIQRIRANVMYSDGMLGRQPVFLRHGEVDNANINPYKKPTKEYPIITQYENYFQVQSGIPSTNTVQPDKLILVYAFYPTINQGTSDILCPQISKTIQELLFKRVANTFLLNREDPRAPGTIQYAESFRKKP